MSESKQNSRNAPEVPFDIFSESARLLVNPAIIDERLHQLWERSAPIGANQVSYTRLSLANLVVLADRSSQQAAEKLILEFAQEKPSRTILVTLCPETEEAPESGGALEAEVTIACSLGAEHGGMLCWERIGIDTPLSRTHQIPNVIRALAGGMNKLVLVDLTTEEFSASVDRELSILADYHFFDSRANRRKLALHLKRSPEKLSGVFDLAYERSHPLREAIKRAFDDPRLRERIPLLSDITMSLSSGSLKQERRVFAYLTGWLAAKLRLTPSGEMSRRNVGFVNSTGSSLVIRTCESESKDHEVEVRFCFADTTLSSMTVCSRDFLTLSDEATSEFHFEIRYNDERHADFIEQRLSDAGYILRRLGDVRRRFDYTDTLSRTKALLGAGPKESAA